MLVKMDFQLRVGLLTQVCHKNAYSYKNFTCVILRL